jgi:hypothetical protein
VALLFDPVINLWGIARSPLVSRQDSSAALLQDGRVLVTGPTCSIEPAPAELYDPDAGTWTGLDGPTQFDGQTISLLVDGRVLLAGGAVPCVGGLNAGGNVVLFDPSRLH